MSEVDRSSGGDEIPMDDGVSAGWFVTRDGNLVGRGTDGKEFSIPLFTAAEVAPLAAEILEASEQQQQAPPRRARFRLPWYRD